MNHTSKNKLNFLFVASDKFPPFRVDVSILFGQELVARGHSIDWLLQSEQSCNTSYTTTWANCRVWVGRTDVGVSRLNRLRKHLYSVFHDFKIFGLASDNRYDFIQVKDKFFSAVLAILAAKMYKTKFIFWLSYPFPEASLYRATNRTARYPILYYIRGVFLKLLLYRIIIPSAAHIFVQSEQMKKDIVAKGATDVKVTPVPMGVSLEMFPGETISNQKNEMKNEKSIVYLGTLTKVRKLDFLIRVFKKVADEIPNTKLYMVGASFNPQDIQDLKIEAEQLGLNNTVVFTGQLPRHDALKYVAMADVCVSPFFPSPILNSTSPTKLVEYMAMGKAVVANDHPEQRLVIAESGSGICVPWEERAFAEAIVRLLKNPLLAREMGIKGRRYVEEKRVYRKIADLVEEQYLYIQGDA